MLSIVIGAVINIVLDPIFIFVFGWGVQGAAIATVISQAMSAAWNVGFLVSGKSSIRLMVKNLKPELRIIGQTFSLGISPFIMSSTESLVTIVLNSGMQRYGGDLYVGSITIMQSVLQLFSAPLTGFTQGVQPIISYNYGAGNFARTKKICLSMIGVSFTISFLANFPVRHAVLWSAEWNPAVLPVIGAGRNLPFHRHVPEGHSSGSAGAHSAALFRCDGNLLCGAGFGYHIRSHGYGAVCAEH